MQEGDIVDLSVRTNRWKPTMNNKEGKAEYPEWRRDMEWLRPVLHIRVT